MEFEFRLPGLTDIRNTPDGQNMWNMIHDDSFTTALITGCPGSGKTTVSIYRLVRLNSQGTPVRLVTFQKMLAHAIKNLAGTHQVPANLVSTFHSWYWRLTGQEIDFKYPPTQEELNRVLAARIQRNPHGEMIVDEGQDIPASVYATLPQFFGRLFVGGDNGQRVNREGAETETIELTLRAQDAMSRRLTLGRNFRNTYETYAFARQFIPRTNRNAWDQNILDRLDHDKRHGDKPIVVTYRDEGLRNEHLKMVLDPANARGNVAVLCPLGPRPKKAGRSGESVDEVHDLVKSMGITASKYHHDVPMPQPLQQHLVTTYISAKGMEFDVVVIPRINFFTPIPEEWYVACTRARRQLIVYRDMKHPQHDPISLFDSTTYEPQTVEPDSSTGTQNKQPF